MVYAKCDRVAGGVERLNKRQKNSMHIQHTYEYIHVCECVFLMVCVCVRVSARVRQLSRDCVEMI